MFRSWPWVFTKSFICFWIVKLLYIFYAIFYIYSADTLICCEVSYFSTIRRRIRFDFCYYKNYDIFSTYFEILCISYLRFLLFSTSYAYLFICLAVPLMLLTWVLYRKSLVEGIYDYICFYAYVHSFISYYAVFFLGAHSCCYFN